jgi:hypothetical protein
MLRLGHYYNEERSKKMKLQFRIFLKTHNDLVLPFTENKVNIIRMEKIFKKN